MRELLCYTGRRRDGWLICRQIELNVLALAGIMTVGENFPADPRDGAEIAGLWGVWATKSALNISQGSAEWRS